MITSSFATSTTFDPDTWHPWLNFMALMISQLCSMISLEVGFRSVDYFYDFPGKRIDFLFHSDHHAY